MSAVKIHDVTGQRALTSGSSAIVELHVLHSKMIFNASEDDWLILKSILLVFLFFLNVLLLAFSASLACDT